MKKGVQEWPLVVFTLTAQTAVGMLFWLSILSLLKSLPPIDPLMAGGWALALAVVGMLASLLHLGNPQRALLAMNRINKSWISREVALAVAFCLSTLGFNINELLRSHVSGPTPAWSIGLLWLSAILGIGLVSAMAQVYRLRTAPHWSSPLTGPGFFMTSLLLGGSLLACLAAPPWHDQRLLPSVASSPLLRLGIPTCLALQAGLVLLDLMRPSQPAAPENPGGFQPTLLRIGLLLAALSALIFWQLFLSTALIVLAELLGRLTFYAARRRLGV